MLLLKRRFWGAMPGGGACLLPPSSFLLPPSSLLLPPSSLLLCSSLAAIQQKGNQVVILLPPRPPPLSQKPPGAWIRFWVWFRKDVRPRCRDPLPLCSVWRALWRKERAGAAGPPGPLLWRRDAVSIHSRLRLLAPARR